MSTLIDYEKNNCYLTNSKNRYFVAEFWIKKILKLKITALIAFQNVITIINKSLSIFEHVINTDIIVYDISNIA